MLCQQPIRMPNHQAVLRGMHQAHGTPHDQTSLDCVQVQPMVPRINKQWYIAKGYRSNQGDVPNMHWIRINNRRRRATQMQQTTSASQAGGLYNAGPHLALERKEMYICAQHSSLGFSKKLCHNRANVAVLVGRPEQGAQESSVEVRDVDVLRFSSSLCLGLGSLLDWTLKGDRGKRV